MVPEDVMEEKNNEIKEAVAEKVTEEPKEGQEDKPKEKENEKPKASFFMHIRKNLGAILLIALAFAASAFVVEQNRDIFFGRRSQKATQESREEETTSAQRLMAQLMGAYYNPILKGVYGINPHYLLGVVDGRNEAIFAIPSDRDPQEVLASLIKEDGTYYIYKDVNGKEIGTDFKIGNGLEATPRRPSYLIGVPYKSINATPDTRISVHIGPYTYSIILKELEVDVDEYTNSIGHETERVVNIDGEEKAVVDPRGFVLKKGVPSIANLVHQIAGSARTKEEAAQKLLNFVTEDMKYDYRDVSYEQATGNELIKEPPESILSKSADCNNKVAVYASLLEQYDIDYVFVFLRHHLAIAVAGDFPNMNGYTINVDGKKYYLAETTAKGFQIGRTLLQDPYNPYQPMNLGESIKFIETRDGHIIYWQ